MDENRRRRSRVATRFQATFTRPGAEPVALRTRNISLKGLLAEPAALIQTNELGLVRIPLGSDAAIAMDGRVIRSDPTGLAIDFLPMDEESFLHLRNLVRYNATDADQIDLELKGSSFGAFGD